MANFADLKKTIATKAKAEAAPTNNAETTDESTPAEPAKANPFAKRATPPSTVKGSGDDKNTSDSLAGKASGEAPKEPAANATATDGPSKPRLASFGVAKGTATKTSPATTGIGGTKANESSGAGTAGGKPAGSTGSESLDGIGAALDALEDSVGGKELTQARPMSQFDDETPADKPLRDLAFIDDQPDDVQKAMRSYVKSLDSVYDLIHDPELLRNVISSLIIEMKSNPQYINKADPKKSLIAPTDVSTWIRVMRESMGLAAIKKSTKKTARKPAASKKVDADMLADLDSLMGLGDL